jgi:hypothetical protein
MISAKTPTVIKYDAGSSQTFRWGHQLRQSLDDRIENIKLLFDPGQTRPYNVPMDLEAEVAKLPKPVVEVASDYMKAIFGHALREIEREAIDKTAISQWKRQFLLTVPAVWSDKAKDMTLKVVITAPEVIVLIIRFTENPRLPRKPVSAR